MHSKADASSLPLPQLASPALSTAPLQAGFALSDLLVRIGDYTDDAVLITEAEPFDEPGPRIVHVNAAFTRMTGYVPDEVLGRSPRLLQGPRTDLCTIHRLGEALRAWQPVRVEILNYRKDGTEFWAEFSIMPVADANGWFRYWVSVQREVNERRHFDEQRQLYSLILASVNEGIVVADARVPDLPLSFVNAGFSRITGYAPAEALGRNCRFLQGPDTAPEAVTQLREALREHRPVTVELLNYRRDGSSFWCRVALAPLRNERGELTHMVGVLHDLTDERARELERVTAQRLRAVGEMTGGIAHDFNNLLTTLSGASELLAARVADQPELLALVDAIREAAARGTSHVRRLLGFSRTPLLARGRVDLDGVMQQLGLLLRQVLRDDVRLDVQLTPGARWLDAEAAQVEAALLNLILNAQDAMPQGGALSVRSRLDAALPGMACIDVEDNGIGMDEATLARIFDPFFTTKGSGRGSGLGLAMVQASVHQLGGQVAVRSQSGVGTCFTLSLPLARPEAPPAPEPPLREDTEAQALNSLSPVAGLRVLMVEDDDAVRMIGATMLRALGHEVTECADGISALAALDACAHYDVLFTDLLMPGGINGLQLAGLARAECPDLHIVLTSGWADSELPKTLAGSTLPFVLKPYSLEELHATLEQLSRSSTGH